MTHNGGRAQANVDFGAGYNDLWAIDQVKQSQGFVPSSVTADPLWATRLNDNGYPTSMLTGGANWLLSQTYIHGIAGDIWVLEWTGTATITMVAAFSPGGLTSSVISANRIEYTITGTPIPDASFGAIAGGPIKVTVTLSAITSLSNLKLYPKTIRGLNTETTYLNQTGAISIFHPAFLDKAQTVGVIRFLNWAQGNFSKAMKWEHVPSEANLSWMGPRIAASLFYGNATKGSGNNIYTCPNSFGTLVNGQAIQMTWSARPTFTAVAAANVTKGSSTAFHIVGHTFTNGDLVSFEQGVSGGSTWAAVVDAKILGVGLPPTYTVTVTGVDDITIDLNSSSFAAPTGTLNLYPRIQISDGVTKKIAYRQGFVNTVNSEWGGGHVSPVSLYGGEVFTAVYHSEFDCFMLGGDNNAQQLLVSAPITAMIKLCNYCEAHPWFVHPYVSEDNFWTQLAATVKANLNSGLIPRFESGNEIWNTGASFWQTIFAQAVAAKYYSQGAGVTAWNYGYAKRLNEVQALIQAVYGTGSDWQMILGCQMGGVDVARLQGPAALNLGNSANYPGNKADYIATAPYLNILPVGNTLNIAGYPGALDQIYNYTQGGTSRQTAFSWWSAELLSASSPTYNGGGYPIGTPLDEAINIMNGHAASVASYIGRRGTGLKRTHYEGGPMQMNISASSGTQWISAVGFPANAPTSGVSVSRADAQNLFAGWLTSTQAGTFMTAYLMQMAAAGVEYPSQFTLSSTWSVTPGDVFPSNFGMWDNRNYTSTSPTPMYTGFSLWNSQKRRFRIAT